MKERDIERLYDQRTVEYDERIKLDRRNCDETTV